MSLVLRVLALSLVLCLTLTQLPSQAHASLYPGLNSPSQLYGVHTCTAPHFRKKYLVCWPVDKTFTRKQFPSAWIAAMTPGDDAFTSTRLDVIVSQQVADNWTVLGTAHQTVSLAWGVVANHITAAFDALNLVAAPGHTYGIEFDETNSTGGATSLGMATFKYTR